LELVKNITSEGVAASSQEKCAGKAFSAPPRHDARSFDDGTVPESGMFCTMGVGLRDLRVWQEAVGLGADVIRS